MEELDLSGHRRRLGLLLAAALIASVTAGLPAAAQAPPQRTAAPAGPPASLPVTPVRTVPAPALATAAPAAASGPQAARTPTANERPALPLGRPGLTETWTVRTLADGVRLLVIRRGAAPAGEHGRARPVDKPGKVGPWTVRVVRINPDRARGTLATTYGSTLAEPEPTTALTRRAGGLAGINASFFSLGDRRGYPGEPAGLTVANGQVLSEPTGYHSETTLLVDSLRNRVRVARLSWSGFLRHRDSGERLRLDAVNRAPAVPRSCRTPAAQRRCTSAGRVAAFTSDFARRTPAGLGAEIVLNRKGCPVRVEAERGVRLKSHQTSLQATGRAAHTLLELAHGCFSQVQRVRDQDGAIVELGRGTSAVTGRYQLLDRGKVVVPHRRGGLFDRHPRTLAGNTRSGTIVLVTIDGRQRHSVGVTLLEAARVARALGMWDAINLDGGGSTTMSVRGRLANRPAGAERAVSDALVWLGGG